MLGIFMLLFGAGFGYAAATDIVPKNGWILWMFAAFCGLIAICCVPGRHVAISGRIVGATVFLVCGWYLASELLHPDPYQGQSSPSLKNALTLFSLWGLPAGYVAIFGVYPLSGKLGHIFGRDPKAK